MAFSPSRSRTGVHRPGTNLRRFSASLALMILALVGVTAPHAQAASATRPTSVGTVVDVNGCGTSSGIGQYVPNLWFEANCNMHDICYGAGLPRGDCDDRFLQDMLQTCQGGTICSVVAIFYHFMVANFGKTAYNASAQARLDRLVADILSCEDDSECERRVSDQAGLDALVDELIACNDDRACEEEVRDRRAESADAPQPPDPDEDQGLEDGSDDWGDDTGDWGDEPADHGDGGGGNGDVRWLENMET